SPAVLWTTPSRLNCGSVQAPPRSALKAALFFRSRRERISCPLHIRQRSVRHSPCLARPLLRQRDTRTAVLPCTLQTGVRSLSNRMRRTKHGKLPALEVYVWYALQEVVWLSGNLQGMTPRSLLSPRPLGEGFSHRVKALSGAWGPSPAV